MAATTRGAVEGRRVIPHPKQTSPFGRPGAVWAAWAQLALCWEETPGPYCPGDIPKLTPPAPGAPGPRRRKKQSFREASWPLGKADQACALSLPQDPGHRQVAGVTGEGRGLVSVGGQGSRWSILFLGLTYLHRLLARALLVRGMEQQGAGWFFGGSRPAICSGSSPPAGQASTALNPVGKGGAGGQKPLSPCRAQSLCRRP